MSRSLTWLVLGTVALSLGGCRWPFSSGRKKRPLDALPRVQKLAKPLPSGRAEACFRLNTGSDQMGMGPKDTGFELVVRYGDRELVQTIDSCENAGGGTALGGGTPTELTVFFCDQKEYLLFTDEGEVKAIRRPKVDKKPELREVASMIKLPAGIVRAVPCP